MGSIVIDNIMLTYLNILSKFDLRKRKKDKLLMIIQWTYSTTFA